MKEKTNGRGKAVILIMGVLLFSGGLAQGDYVDIYDDTIINNSLNADSIVIVHNSAQVTVESTDYVTFELIDLSVVSVYGGNATYRAYDSSVLNLYNGDFTTRSPSVGYDGSSAKIYFHGQNFEYQPSSGGDGWLSGNWLDGSAFNIYLRGLPQPFEDSLGTNIFLVPEPSTIGLFGLSYLLLRKKTKILCK